MALPTGLSYFPNVVPEEFNQEILDFFSSEIIDDLFPVRSTNGRHVANYGFRYDYTNSKPGEPVKPIPEVFSRLLELVPQEIPREKLNQCIVNRYLAGQGIGAHIDHPSYGDMIVCFTFESGGTMIFTREKERKDLYVEPRSVYIMTGEARYQWKHEMRGWKKDGKIPRGVRWSVTFRMV